MTFDDLINKLTDHLSPRPSEIAERFRFHKREQTVGETVAVYILPSCGAWPFTVTKR